MKKKQTEVSKDGDEVVLAVRASFPKMAIFVRMSHAETLDLANELIEATVSG